MIMTKDCKPELACSKDETREKILNPWITKHKDGRHYMCASDGAMAVLIPVDMEEGETTGPVPIEALQKARKLSHRNNPKLAMGCNGDIKLQDGTSYARNQAVDMADLECYFNDPVEVTQTVTLDVGRLKRIADAMGCLAVRIEFCMDPEVKPKKGEKEQTRFERPMRIYPSGSGGPFKVSDPQARAVLMPIRKY